MYKKLFVLSLMLLGAFTLVACQEKEPLRLPNIINLTQTEADDILKGYDLIYTFEEEINLSVPEGRVIRYEGNLKPNDEIEPKTTIKIIVSVHKNVLPELDGLYQSEIIQAFRDLNVYIQFRESLSTSKPEGIFLNYGNNRKAGDIVEDNSEIIIYVAKQFVETERKLMISKYAEGSGSNRSLELYNHSDVSINLADYKLNIYQDGSQTPSIVIELEGTLASKETYVLVHTDSEQSFKDNADLITSDLAFNGNDMFSIEFKTGDQIDVLGQIGSGLYMFLDVTLVRHIDKLIPSTTFNISDWGKYAKNNVSMFGTHPMAYPETFTFNPEDLLISFDSPRGMIEVDFVSNNDGDTAQFTPGFLNDNRVRFIGIDTPETGSGLVATQAKNYVGSKLSGANTIYIQHDPASGNTETYGRYLGLIWYDGKLLNYELVLNGYSQNNYSDIQERLIFNGISLQIWMQNAQAYAKANKLGIWG